MKLDKVCKVQDLIRQVTGLVEVLGGDPEANISAVDTIDTAQQGSISWIRGNKTNQDALAIATQASVVVCEHGAADFRKFATEQKCFLAVKDAKLAMVLLLKLFEAGVSGIEPTAVISPQASLGKGVSVGHGSIIGKATIGDNVTIASNVIIHDNVRIGNHVTIHPQVVIGPPGFNYATDAEGAHHSFPHFGGVQVGDACEIASQAFISAGVLGPTKIGKGTKIAQFVYIGANVRVGDHCQIRARASVLGSVKIGNRVVIAPSATLRDEVAVGDGALIGMGAVVVRSVPENCKVMGVPAKPV